MKQIIILALLTASLFGSLYNKNYDLDNEMESNYLDQTNLYMVDEDVSLEVVNAFTDDGFKLPDSDSWMYIIDYYKAIVIAYEYKDYDSIERVLKTMSKKYNDGMSQYNLGHLYDLGLVSTVGNESANDWFLKSVDNGYLASEMLNQLTKGDTHWQVELLPSQGVLYYTDDTFTMQNQFGFLIAGIRNWVC